MSAELRDRILNYSLDKAQATKTYEEFGIDATIEELVTCFQAPLSIDELSMLRCFLRDGLSTGLAAVEEIRIALGASKLPQVMLERLLTSMSSERNILVDAMRANIPGHKENFHIAFHHFRDIDPLLMPTLLREASWTGATHGLDLYWQLLESPCYLSRWSVAESDLVSGPDKRLLKKMIHDSHLRTRREAEYRLALLQRDENNHDFLSSENKKKREEIEATRPLTFGDLSLLFWRYQCPKGQEIWSYTVEELSAFEQTLPELYRWK